MNRGSKNDPPRNTPWSGDRHFLLLLRELEAVEALTALIPLSGDLETARRTCALAERFYQNVADRAYATNMSDELRRQIGQRLDRLRAELDRLSASFADGRTDPPSP